MLEFRPVKYAVGSVHPPYSQACVSQPSITRALFLVEVISIHTRRCCNHWRRKGELHLETMSTRSARGTIGTKAYCHDAATSNEGLSHSSIGALQQNWVPKNPTQPQNADVDGRNKGAATKLAIAPSDDRRILPS